MIQTDKTLYLALDITSMAVEERIPWLGIYFKSTSKTDVEIFQALLRKARNEWMMDGNTYEILKTFDQVVREIAGEKAEELIDKYYKL